MDAITGAFLETRTLMCGVLADYLTSRYAMKNGYRARPFEERLRYMVGQICPDMPKADVRRATPESAASSDGRLRLND